MSASPFPPGITPIPRPPALPKRKPAPGVTEIGPAVVVHHHGVSGRAALALGCGAMMLLALLLGGVGIGYYAVTHQPLPVPTPAPINGTLWVTLVYDPDAPGTEFARLELDPALTEGVNALGGHLRELAKDSPVLDKQNLTQFTAKHGVPTLILQAEGSKAAKAMPCPNSAAKVIDAAKRFKRGEL